MGSGGGTGWEGWNGVNVDTGVRLATRLEKREKRGDEWLRGEVGFVRLRPWARGGGMITEVEVGNRMSMGKEIWMGRKWRWN